MTIDPVAAYAAVVATAALGWQVYQWRSERRGSLSVWMVAHWWASTDHDDEAWSLNGVITNRNDYPVRLDGLSLLTAPPGRETKRVIGPVHRPGEMGLPDEIPARANARFDWPKSELERMLLGLPFRPGDTVKLIVVNSLFHDFSITATVLDRDGILPHPVRGWVTPAGEQEPK